MSESLFTKQYDQPIRIPLKTIQMANWRKVSACDGLLDTTIKSGNPMLAPTWDLLNSYKRGEIDSGEYTRRFIELMESRIAANQDFYRDLFIESLVGRDALVLACYCRCGDFCHRYILAKQILPKAAEFLGLVFEYLGEVT